MNRSKLVVAAVVAFILVGTLVWAGAERFFGPEYNPEKAHLYMGHFNARCSAGYDADVCEDVIGHHHRRCFTDHLEETPADQLDEHGPILYDRGAYLECMEEELE